ncbi:MAG: serine hydrolase domain-containing protein [Chloroflexota bacterium]|nr:serine hydrolase domain-containing protein [Chloroflexota bacterium]
MPSKFELPPLPPPRPHKSAPNVAGICDDRFLKLREEFVKNFVERGDIGASVAVCLEGELVVDLWAGWQDEKESIPWVADTLVPVWSIGKAVTAIAVLRLVDQGRISLDDRVSTYWPEFAQAGKRDVTVRMLLGHRAGLPAVEKILPESLQLTDWDAMCSALAEQTPWWTPDTGHGYHTNTIGFLLGELVRRVTDRRVGEVIREDIANPLGAEFFVGLDEEHDDRTADWISYKPLKDEIVPDRQPWKKIKYEEATHFERMSIRTYGNPKTNKAHTPASRVWRSAEFPSTNPHSNARSVALIFGALANGGHGSNDYSLLSTDTIDQAREIASDGVDLVLGRPTRFGLGFQLAIPDIRPLGPNPGTFGHYGNGGHIGIADPEARLSLAYSCNQSGRSWRDPRNIALVDAVFQSFYSN